MVMYLNANRSNAMSFLGFLSLRGDLFSSKVIHKGGGALYAVAAREFHSLHKALANFRKPLRRFVGESTSYAVGFVNNTFRVTGYAANPALKRTCLRPAA